MLVLYKQIGHSLVFLVCGEKTSNTVETYIVKL